MTSHHPCADPGIIVRGGGGGGPGQSDPKKALTTFFFFFFFLALSLIYRSQMVNFKEIYHFSRFQGGGGVQLFPGGSNCLFTIENHITWDFPGGGGPDPLSPLWIRTWPINTLMIENLVFGKYEVAVL